MSQFVKVGESRIWIEAKGCIDCGTYIAVDWCLAETVVVRVGEAVRVLVLRRCGACENARGAAARHSYESPHRALLDCL